MKINKLLLILVSIVLLFNISGCSSSSVNNTQEPKEKVAETNNDTINEENKVENPDFRNTKWGMTKDEVKKYETAELFFEDDITLIYSVSVKGLDATLTYLFNNDGQLYDTSYVFEEKHENKNLYIDDYKLILNSLNKKFKQENKLMDGFSWINNMYKDNPDKYGLAISLRHLFVKHIWDTQNSEIYQSLSGINNEIIHTVQYVSKNINAPKK